MSDNVQTRKRRTPEERAAAIDEKIQSLNNSITALEEKKAATDDEIDKKIAGIREQITTWEGKKADILTPKQKPRQKRKSKKQKITELIKMAEKSGLKIEEIASRLDVELPQ